MTDDPLDGADIGDTATVRETTDIWVGGMLEADATEGTDRLVDSEIVGTEVVTDEYGDQHLRVTVESDVTKRLPRRWDEHDAPRTDSERRDARRQAWRSRLGKAASVLLPMAVATVIGTRVTNEVIRSGGFGGDMAPFSLGQAGLVVGAVVLFSIFVLALAREALFRGVGGVSP